MYTLHVRMYRMNPGLIARVLNACADVQAHVLRDRDPYLLYDSGVVYHYEAREEVLDRDLLLSRGRGDCVSLSVARAAEFIAWGGEALMSGDPGYPWAGPIQAEVVAQHQVRGPQAQFAHLIVQYRLNGIVYRDDPSARLGMHDNMLDASVLQRWEERGVRARSLPKGVS